MKKNRKLCVVLGVMTILLYGCARADTQVPKEHSMCKNLNEQNHNVYLLEDVQESLNADEILDISLYPYRVQGEGDIDVEIFSSANSAEEWLVEMVKKFNEKENLVNGKTISISLKCIPSEVIFESILYEEYVVPDVFISENEFLPEILHAKGIECYQENDPLLKNSLGFVMNQKGYDSIQNTYGVVNFNNIQQAVMDNEIKIGSTNLNSLNFIVSSLYSLDSENLLSDVAVTQFQDFKSNITEVPQIMHICNAMKWGVLDATMLDYNTYVNTPELKNYFFIPFGVAENNSLYVVENIPAEKARALKLFGYYAKSVEAQQLAVKFGFRTYDYVSEIPAIEGETLLKVWNLMKEKK